LLSWEYKKIASVDEINYDKIYHKLKRWSGNKIANEAGHITISIGDIVKVGDNARIITGRGWVIVPPCIWKKIKIK